MTNSEKRVFAKFLERQTIAIFGFEGIMIKQSEFKQLKKIARNIKQQQRGEKGKKICQ